MAKTPGISYPMPKKPRRKSETSKSEKVKPSPTVESLRRRRNRRLIFVGLIGLSFPVLEVIAYQFRVITMTIDNRSDVAITRLKVSYPGGSFEEPEIKPGGEITRLTRPDFSFKGAEFSTYMLTIQFSTSDGRFFRQTGRAGALDFSSSEKYAVEIIPTVGQVQLKHSTSPGFPLSLIRDLLTALGMG